MAGLAKMLEIRSTFLKVGKYSVSATDFVGQGAYGVVYKGTDSTKNPVAAKRIDGTKHPRILGQNLNRLMELDHTNIVKIIDIERINNILWIFMSYYKLGNLDSFYATRDVSLYVGINIMIQMASGIEYLHSKNVIHRDVKPGNILVASEDPVVVQLTDFYVSKCLDPEVETSLMSSDVGSFAFKAVEFFQRTESGRIEYHSNVDIYACALTFLAILQAKKGKRLIPQIETPQETSEIHARSIGALIAERIKYKVKELNVVVVSDESSEGVGSKALAINGVKKLIMKMTNIDPAQRCSAGQVLHELKRSLSLVKLNLSEPMFGTLVSSTQ